MQITDLADKYTLNVTPELIGFMRRNPNVAKEFVSSNFANDQVPAIRTLLGSSFRPKRQSAQNAPAELTRPHVTRLPRAASASPRRCS